VAPQVDAMQGPDIIVSSIGSPHLVVIPLLPYIGFMVNEPEKRRDRYDVSGKVEAQFVDAAQTVLRNKLGITDLATLQTTEEQALARAYRILLKEVRTDTRMTCDLLKHIHARIFGDLYEWAGHWRTVWISKPGTTWPAPDFLEQNMQAYKANVLCKYPAHALQDDEAFCSAVGEIQGEFLVIHPFREGNARTIKLATDLLAAQTDRPLLVYDQTEEGQQQYIDAAKAAFKHQYTPMIEIIRRAFAQAQNRL
jgi:cell filamentation protein